MDRFNQKIAEITSINIEELPNPLLRCTVLKAAVKDSFPITHALMANTKAQTNKALEDKLIEMAVNCEEENALGSQHIGFLGCFINNTTKYIDTLLQNK